MNEHIQELAKEAKLSIPIGALTVPEWIEAYNQKFAELIVAECATIINDIPSSPQGSWSDGYYEGCRDSSKQIKEHFGVEE